MPEDQEWQVGGRNVDEAITGPQHPTTRTHLVDAQTDNATRLSLTARLSLEDLEISTEPEIDGDEVCGCGISRASRSKDRLRSVGVS